MKEENIAAISTALAPSGVAVIRISGDSPLAVAEKMFKPSGKTPVADFTPNMMYTGEILADGFTDFGLCVYFKAPKSFTGEDVVEFHSHGGVAIAQGVLKAALGSGARLARNGEFTKRAFLNGKMSLASAEGLIDMINSSSVSGVKAGYSLYREKLTAKITAIQDELIKALSQIDADIDFPEEGLEETSRAEVKSVLVKAISDVDALIGGYRQGRKLVRGVKVAICGRPNVGKSSLLNALLGYDKAIVSDVAGTTRDVVEGAADINGVTFNFYDTAGIRKPADEIENMGVKLSEKTAKSADVSLFLFTATGKTAEDDDAFSATESDRVITVASKCDLTEDRTAKAEIFVSAKTGEGVDGLRRLLYEKTVGKVDVNGDFLCEERHYAALVSAREKLRSALDGADGSPLDILAVDITGGWRDLGEITGKTASEEIINDIFSRFCVGK